ncbi:MAG: serine/threonine protein kinase, partial [Acidobacteria bacterium]|nr:serine/threonine protein kinase [Acidobacteriota bacterium]
GESEGRPFIVMEWLEGETLEHLLAREGQLSIPEAARIAVELLEALSAAHRSGVVHRDVKPANLILLPGGRLKVTDFGIAHVAGSDLVKTRAGDVLATPLFASPEQLLGQEVDGRADLFSVGVLLYLSLTGRQPFLGKTFAELVTRVLQTEPEPPSRLRPGLPAALDAVILKALAKAREGRYPNARVFAEALGPFLSFEAQAERTEVLLPVVSATVAAPPQVPATPQDLAPTMVRRGLSREPEMLVREVVSAWPARALGKTPAAALLSRLLEFPIHAEPFSGAVIVGERTLLLLHDGWILAAADFPTGRKGDAAMGMLPAEADAVLLTPPSGLPPGAVPLLASLLLPRAVRHADLDSTFVNLPALSRKLAAERFTGILTLRHGAAPVSAASFGAAAIGHVLLDEGTNVLTLFSDGWSEAPLGQPWESWVSDLVVKASVEEPAFAPVAESFRRLLPGFEVSVAREGEAAPAALGSSLFGRTVTKRLGRTPTGQHKLDATGLHAPTLSGGAPRRILETAWQHAPSRRLLSYLLDELPAVLAERGKLEAWKYLGTWVPLVAKARLHHDLPRPASRESDRFDLVTEDAAGKVLHLAERVAVGNADAVRGFLARAIAAKTARTKTGDIGGALLVAPSFDAEAEEVYRQALAADGETRSSWLSALESATHYEGFVRLGARRGFHLLLVKETAQGFEPLL